MGGTWIGKCSLARTGRRSSRRLPVFAHDLWNVYLEILGEDPVVANNGLESWNRTWNQEMGTKPKTWKIVQGFVNQESETKRILVSNAAGRDMNTNTGRKSLVKNQFVRIGGIVQQYNTLPIEQYLNLIPHEFSLH